MGAIRRVALPVSEASPQGVVCANCGQRTPVGFPRCGECGEALFRPRHEQVQGAGQFSRRVRHGEEMPKVTDYLRANGYPIGESPERYWRRRQRREGPGTSAETGGGGG